ncbi:MAG: gas vesicle protein K [Acidobacteria bacterium]|nr:gas vesicle protein K [Acidobacteriota bacterium]
MLSVVSRTRSRTRPARKRRGRPATAPKRRRGRIVAKAEPASPKRRRNRIVAKAGALTVSEVRELRELRRQLERAGSRSSPARWNADPDEVRRSVAHLVLTLVEFIRRLLERQAIRRMESGTLTARQTEDVGRALMQLEETIRDIAATFGIAPEELNLDLGPAGKLM